MINIFRTLINFLLPHRCLCCGVVLASHDSLCADCFNNITFISKPYCKCCGRPLYTGSTEADDLYCVSCLNKRPNFRYSRAAIRYDNFSKRLVLDFKFAAHIENKKLLARWLYLAGKDIFEAGADLIVPVPLHYTRLLKRKYNQSAVLAGELAKMTNIIVDYDVLKKIKYTLPQTQCDGKQRHKNIKGAFTITHPERIKGKRIVLIDDVYTTGSTTKECTKTLLKFGAKSVDILTVAKVID
ncbi:MAG: ComF family protein [Alphaproteobacteria bacterium]|nr:ComF family protein [Alphaproteobacteria bacterium]